MLPYIVPSIGCGRCFVTHLLFSSREHSGTQNGFFSCSFLCGQYFFLHILELHFTFIFTILSQPVNVRLSAAVGAMQAADFLFAVPAVADISFKMMVADTTCRSYLHDTSSITM